MAAISDLEIFGFKYFFDPYILVQVVVGCMNIEEYY